MKEKFESFVGTLTVKSALVVGLIAGLVLFAVIGFVILGGMAIVKNAKCPVLTSEEIVAEPVVIPKSDKPVVELFIMSYCPFGLQMQKAYLPVMELFGQKAEMDIKFVSYAMHDKPEVDENTRQYCLQKEQTNKYMAYAKCFVSSDKFATCLKSTGVDEGKLNSCVTKTDKDFQITEIFNDQTSWGSDYPPYPIYTDLNTLYKVEGSPTLVINGVQVDTDRSPEMIKRAVCDAFNDQPVECDTVLDLVEAEPGFDFESFKCYY